MTEVNQDRAERFIHLYNEIDEQLRVLLKERRPSHDRYLTFVNVVREVAKFNSRVRDRKDDLLEYADLRNALVHTAGRNGIRYLAEPYPEVIDDFEQLVAAIVNPKRAAQIGSHNPRRFSPEDSLATALEYMRDAGHGQIVVQGNGPTQLLSSRGVANWFGQHLGETMTAIDAVPLAEVLPHQPAGSFDVIGRETTIDEIRARFLDLVSPNGERLLALIVTHSGKPTEKAIGIITAWDVVATTD